jgi:(2R)-sulfolactate sulfo-lyase subunit beta
MAHEKRTNGYSNLKFWGYRRENGRVGVRNHVVILPLDDLSNAACEAVANNIKGTLALPHAYGRLQFGQDLDLHFRTLIGTGSNPNVAAVVVIGIEDQWTNRVVEGIAKTGKPVTGFGIEGTGDIGTVAKAARVAKDYLQKASEQKREECDVSELWVSTKCGESDTTTGLASCPTVGNMYDKLIPVGIYGCFGETSEITGGEHLAKERAATPEVGEKWYRMWKAYQDEVIEAHKTDDLSDSQPTKGNIAGGLTTIEEKALGNLEKIGRECRYIDALEPAGGPGQGAGPVLHGYVLGCGRMRDPDGGGRVRGPHLPDRAGQRDRQSDRPGDQDLGQSAHGAHHVGAHRRRRLGRAAPRHDHPGGGRCLDRDGGAHRERPAHRGRGARPPRVRDDETLSERVIFPRLC